MYSPARSHPTRVVNKYHTVGFLPKAELAENCEIEQVSVVDSQYLIEWARLVRYCEPTDFGDVRIVTAERHGSKVLGAIVPRNEDRVIAVAPRVVDRDA